MPNPLTVEQIRAVQYAEKQLNDAIDAVEHQLRNLKAHRDAFARVEQLNERSEYVSYFLQVLYNNHNVRIDLLAKAIAKLEVQSDRIDRAS